MEIDALERIWKEAIILDFESKREKPINFETIKSIHFIDKFKSTYKFNLIGLMATALLILVAFVFGGVPVEGITLFILFSILVITGYRKLVRLNAIKKEISTKDYILAFNKWLKLMLKDFQYVNRFIYPLLFLTFISALLNTNIFSMLFGQTLWESIVSNPSTYLYKDLPVFYIMSFLAVAILISVYSKKLFKLDIESVYGEMKVELETIFMELSK